MKKIKLLLFIAILIVSCKTSSNSMKELNSQVQFKRDDFIFSNQVEGEAQQLKIFCIDFTWLLNKGRGEIKGSSEFEQKSRVLTKIPIVGSYFIPNKLESYAIYDMIKKNPGYDAVFYPTFEATGFKIPFIFSNTNIKVKAKLAKLTPF